MKLKKDCPADNGLDYFACSGYPFQANRAKKGGEEVDYDGKPAL